MQKGEKELYVLKIYSLVNDNTYRVNRKVFSSHQKGIKWAVENYGWTDSMYSGKYVSEAELDNSDNQERVTYIKKDRVTEPMHLVSDLEALVLELKRKTQDDSEGNK